MSIQQRDTPPGPSREKIWRLFDEISPTYDLTNRFMTFGLDQLWRKKIASYLPNSPSLSILDCATGTGDQMIALLQMCPHIDHIVGIDLSKEMLGKARHKLASYVKHTSFDTLCEKTLSGKKGSLLHADLLSLPFQNSQFDAVTLSFGIRNVTDTKGALCEMLRVLTDQGKVLILEGTNPAFRPLSFLHRLYLRHLLPRIGGIISGHPQAYRYLNKTIETFPEGSHFIKKMEEVGFVNVQAYPFFGGVVTLYCGEKRI